MTALSKYPPASVKAAFSEGGDERRALDATGRNAYGCKPIPESEVLALGACTASPPSVRGFEAANTLLETLLTARDPSFAQQSAWQSIETRWKRLCGLPESTACSFADSGTALHQMFSDHLGRTWAGRPCSVITVEASETGSHIPTILSTYANYQAIPLRDIRGRPRSTEAVDADVLSTAHAAHAQGHLIWLLAIDVSKTGLQAPSPTALARLQAEIPEAIFWMDACQFRCAPGRWERWLAEGHWLALTGSKFMGGPAFSGVLLHREKKVSGTGDVLSNTPLLLGFEAATRDIEDFLSHPTICIKDALEGFAQSVEASFQQCRHLRLWSSPAPVRSSLLEDSALSWDALPTVFSFEVLSQTGEAAWPASALRKLRHAILLGWGDVPRCHLGQVVSWGDENTPAHRAILRLSASARWVNEALAYGLTPSLNEVSDFILRLDAALDTAITSGSKQALFMADQHNPCSLSCACT